MYKIVIFSHPKVQRGRVKLSLLVASSPLRFAAIEDSQRKMVKGRAWTKAEDMACIKAFVIVSEDAVLVCALSGREGNYVYVGKL
jgi:hypothetical protein